jgi:hypothetical protein
MMREWHTTFAAQKGALMWLKRSWRVVEVLVVLVLLGWGYLALAASPPEEDRLVMKGIQQIVICGKGSTQSGDIWYKITQEIPGADSGEWGVEKDGDCRVLRHYVSGPAD